MLAAVACSEATTDPSPVNTPPAIVCGDGMRDPLEPCDGADLGGADCIAAGFEGGKLACLASCAFDTSACTGTGPSCGDGIVGGLEQCDGLQLNGGGCIGLGFDGGTLACSSACAFDLSGCTRTPSTGPQPYVGFDHEGAVGCEGVYNVEQVLTYHFEMEPSAWTALRNDTTYTTYYRASLRCEDGPAIDVGVRRKRSGGSSKPGMKIDFNQFVPEQTYYDLHKLSFEIGASSGGTTESDRRDIVAEYLANRLMVLSGAHASRTAFADVFVNGERVGVYVNVEQIDKRFLRDRFGDDSGWLYKKSGGIDDGFKTNETRADPYDAYFCFWNSDGCAVPSSTELASTLPMHLDLGQILRMGAVNALIGNTDAPIFKDNNYYFYDYPGGPRLYLAWDLDTTMTRAFDVFTGEGIGGARPLYTDVLFTNWEDDYDAMLADLLQTPLALAVIEAELDRAARVGSAALDADPVALGGTSDAFDGLRSWWQTRHAEVSGQVAVH
jgi:hypothetical protein